MSLILNRVRAVNLAWTVPGVDEVRNHLCVRSFDVVIPNAVLAQSELVWGPLLERLELGLRVQVRGRGLWSGRWNELMAS